MGANHENGSMNLTGRVVWFSEEKGFGLIECEDGEAVVVDHTAILSPESGERVFKTLESGSPVELELSVDSEGRRFAKMVRLVEV